MSKHEILITTDNDNLVVKLFAFFNKQPAEVPNTTLISVLEDGTKDLVDEVLEKIDAIIRKRRKRLDNLSKSLRESIRVENSLDSQMEDNYIDPVAEFDHSVQEYPEDHQL